MTDRAVSRRSFLKTATVASLGLVDISFEPNQCRSKVQ
ncbi:MAG: twin-arginine translocation signal domain-containing protein, partial [Caldilineaceae bacterium SB0665_bin_25]|nr:twin-arginine translocation signal domain-containing protein [Caldilineaceae bacterium SB0665_bin_25]